jgi:hypothetical protein
LTPIDEDERKVTMAREAWGLVHDYPIVELTTHGAETVPHAGVDLGTLREQLVPVRDALLELFEAGGGKRHVALQRLEVGLSVTRDGRVAFATGNATASLTLTFERRQPATATRTPKPKAAASDERRAQKAAAGAREPQTVETGEPQAPAESGGPDLIKLD